MKKKLSILMIVLLMLNSLLSFGIGFAEGDLPEGDIVISDSTNQPEGEAILDLDGLVEQTSETVTGDPVVIEPVEYVDMKVSLNIFGDNTNAGFYNIKIGSYSQFRDLRYMGTAIFEYYQIASGDQSIKVYSSPFNDYDDSDDILIWEGSINIVDNMIYQFNMTLGNDASLNFVDSYEVPEVTFTSGSNPVTLENKSIEKKLDNGYNYVSEAGKGVHRFRGKLVKNGFTYYIEEEFDVLEGAQTYEIDFSNYMEVEIDDQLANTYVNKYVSILEDSTLGYSTTISESKVGILNGYMLQVNAYLGTESINIISSPENLEDGVFSFDDTVMYTDTSIVIPEGASKVNLSNNIKLFDGFNNKIKISPMTLSLYQSETLVKEITISDLENIYSLNDLVMGTYKMVLGFGQISDSVIEKDMTVEKGSSLNIIFKSQNLNTNDNRYLIKIDGLEEHVYSYGEWDVRALTIDGVMPGSKEISVFMDKDNNYNYSQDELLGTISIDLSGDDTLELSYNEHENLLEHVLPYTTPKVNIYIDDTLYEGKVQFKQEFEFDHGRRLVYSEFPFVGSSLVTFEDRLDNLVCYYFTEVDLQVGETSLNFNNSDLKKISVKRDYQDETYNTYVNIKYMNNHVGSYEVTGTDYYVYGADFENVKLYSSNSFNDMHYSAQIDTAKAINEGVVLTDSILPTTTDIDVIKDRHISFVNLLGLQDSNGNIIENYYMSSPPISKVTISNSVDISDELDINIFDYNKDITSYPIGSYKITADLSAIGITEPYEFVVNIVNSPMLGVLGTLKYDGASDEDEYFTVRLYNSENDGWQGRTDSLHEVLEHGFAGSLENLDSGAYRMEVYISDNDGDYIDGKPKVAKYITVTNNRYIEGISVDLDELTMSMGTTKEFPSVELKIDGELIPNSDYEIRRVRFISKVNEYLDFRSSMPLYGDSKYYVVLNYKGTDSSKAPIQVALGDISLDEGAQLYTIDLDLSNQREVTFNSHISNSDYVYGINLFVPGNTVYIDDIDVDRFSIPETDLNGYMVHLYSQNNNRYFYEKYLGSEDALTSIDIDNNFEVKVDYSDVDINNYLTFSEIVKITDSYGNLLSEVTNYKGNSYYIPYIIKDEFGMIVKEGTFKTNFDRKKYLEGLADGNYTISLDLSALNMDDLDADIDVITKPDVTIIPGDTDLNGEVNALDAALALEYSLKLANLEPDQIKAADFNGDGEVNALDSSLILQKSVKLIP